MTILSPSLPVATAQIYSYWGMHALSASARTIYAPAFQGEQRISSHTAISPIHSPRATSLAESEERWSQPSPLEFSNGWLKAHPLFRPISRDREEWIDEVVSYILYRLEKEGEAISPEERRFLIEYTRFGDNFHYIERVSKALHLFDGFRQIVARHDYDRSLDRLRALFALEEYEEFFAVMDRKPGVYALDRRNYLADITPAIVEHVHRYAGKRGYGPPITFEIHWDTCALMGLRKYFDLAIPIAKGGLFSGAMAEMLGMATIATDVKAHDRDVPTSHFVDKFDPKEIEGKRVLLLDKDAVTAATIREAARLLAPFNPASIAVYFNHPVCADLTRPEAVMAIERMGIEVFHRGNVPAAPYLDGFFTLHEFASTPLGRLKAIERKYDEFLEERFDDDPQSAISIYRFMKGQVRFFFSLNQFLPGTDELRRAIVSRLEKNYETYLGTPLSDRRDYKALANLLEASRTMPLAGPETLARARYHRAGVEAAKRRDVENIHVPSSLVDSFASASQAAAHGYDVALIVGPEGFAYEPIFEDLGMETVSINIPEDDPYGERTLEAFDDLSALQGKRVLVVEDDVVSGATLRRILEEFGEHRPSYLGLYTGANRGFVNRGNIPDEFEAIHLTNYTGDEGERQFLEHLASRETLYKN